MLTEPLLTAALASARTRKLKLAPFEEWVRPMLASGDKVTSYVAIRADESYREGYAAKAENLFVKLPFREAGIDKAGDALTSVSEPQRFRGRHTIAKAAPSIRPPARATVLRYSVSLMLTQRPRMRQ